MQDGPGQACESNDIYVKERIKENAERSRRLISHELKLGLFNEGAIQLLMKPLAS